MNHDLRELYENYTRRIRFDTYRYVGYPVILGHNKDDCFENILTNINSKSKYENLKGMTGISVNEGITFLRPMLYIPKEDIYDFANIHNMPYLYDSTPKWSARGRIRDTIVPVLNDWSENLIPSFFDLSDTMSSLTLILHKYIDSLLKHKIIIGKLITIFAYDPIPCDKLIWKTIIQRLQLNIPNPSTKSIDNFLSRYSKNHNIYAVLSKNLSVKINGSDIIFACID
jgi:tRNA(Ile)-lysidine synthase TilS/MesJ